MDKLWASEQFAHSRLRVPAKTPIEEASPETAAERYGFPLVVKARVGCSGNQVRIAHDLPGLHTLVRAGWARAGLAFYEQYVHGDKLNYGAAVGPTGVEQEVAYRVAEWRQPVGSAEVVETVDDQRLTELGRRAVEAARCTGLVNIDVIRDDEGRDWLIDFNPRAFGGSVSFLGAGLDLSEGYLCAIGARDRSPSRRSPAVGARIHVFPTCIEGVADSGKVVRTASAYVREARPYLAWLGLRYWVVEAGVTTYAVMAASLGLPSRRRAAAGDGP